MRKFLLILIKPILDKNLKNYERKIKGKEYSNKNLQFKHQKIQKMPKKHQKTQKPLYNNNPKNKTKTSQASGN